ncbi:MAG: biopolymer transporter ExbD [Planctomycetota bacterium]
MRIRRKTAGEIRLEMTPLIDVVFLMLTFFVFSFVLMVRADTLGITLPELPSASQPEDVQLITVAVTNDAELRLGGELVEIESLADAVTRALEEMPEARVVISADDEAPSGLLLRALDRLSEAGVTNVGFLSQPSPSASPEAE